MASSRQQRSTTPDRPEQGIDPAFVPVAKHYLRRDTIPGFDLYVVAGGPLSSLGIALRMLDQFEGKDRKSVV